MSRIIQMSTLSLVVMFKRYIPNLRVVSNFDFTYEYRIIIDFYLNCSDLIKELRKGIHLYYSQ